MGDVLSWFRVDTNAKGKILSVRLVEAAGTNAARVFYVEAENELAARRAGREAFNAYCAARNRTNRARLSREGRCKCGRLRNLSGALCSVCLEASKAHSERSAARKRGEVVPPADWKGTRDARRAEEAARLRLNVLEEVESIWQARGGAGLRQWLILELTRLRKERAA